MKKDSVKEEGDIGRWRAQMKDEKENRQPGREGYGVGEQRKEHEGNIRLSQMPPWSPRLSSPLWLMGSLALSGSSVLMIRRVVLVGLGEDSLFFMNAHPGPARAQITASQQEVL